MKSLLNFGPRTGFGDDWLRLGCIGELAVDGETLSAVRYEPPGQREKWAGDLRYTQEELNDLVLRIHTAGFQPCIHAIGDKAQDMLLEAYERAQKAVPTPDPRYRIEHAGNEEAGATTPERMERMKRLGVIPVLTGAWINLPTGWDPIQAKVPFIYRTLRANGFRTPGSSDSVGSQPASWSPFFSIWAMVTRKISNDGLLAPQEAITVGEAIRSYTIDSAYTGFEEKIKGSIEPGKLADLIVVSADPLTVPSDQLKGIRILTMVLDGKIVISEGRSL